MNRKCRIRLFLATVMWMVSFTMGNAQPRDTVAGIPVNYDESKVGAYLLPDPLTLNNGSKITDKDAFINQRVPEILNAFKENQFGKVPSNNVKCTYELFDKGTPALDQKALRKQVCVYFTGDTVGPRADVLIYLPIGAEKPVPLMLMINFTANSSMVEDSGVKRGEIWSRDKIRVPAPERRNFENTNIISFLENGIGVAMLYYGDIEPDFPEGIEHGGVRGMLLKTGESYPAADEWGAIGAWAWGLSRVLDFLQTDKDIDKECIGLFGISRLGKTVLWTGASDPRFAFVIASCSGEGGAALSRRYYGETIAHLASPSRYFYQFCGNYQKFSDNPEKLPVDAHMLLALIAPRPVLLQTGTTDKWSDPKGEFLAAIAAEPVYNLFGKKGLETNQMPGAGEAILNSIGYYMHEGGHGTIPSDVPVFIEFIRKHFFK